MTAAEADARYHNELAVAAENEAHRQKELAAAAKTNARCLKEQLDKHTAPLNAPNSAISGRIVTA